MEEYIEVKSVSDIPEDILKVINLNVTEYFQIETCDLDDIGEYIMEQGDEKETIEYDYVFTEYLSKFAKFELSLSSSQYRKDGGLCDSQLDEYFYLKIYDDKLSETELVTFDVLVQKRHVLELKNEFAEMIKKYKNH